MKKLLATMIAGSAILLTACGGSGSSESSSFSGSMTLANGNKYSCPSKVKMDACKDDASCAAGCEMTYQAVKPIDESTGGCIVNNKIIVGVVGESCITPIKIFGKNSITCQENGSIQVGSGGASIISDSISYGGYSIACKK